MPAPRRRASLLGHSSVDCPVSASTCGGRVIVSSCVSGPRGMLVGSSTGTRVTRRALGISSVFLQGTRSSTAPVAPKPGLVQSGLGWSLVDYRDKVQVLEKLNLDLEEQIRTQLQLRAHSAASWTPLRQHWESAYREVSEWILSNAKLMLEMENVQANAEDFKERLEAERPFRESLEEESRSLLRVMEDAAQSKLELQRQTNDLRSELQGLHLHHQQDVRGLYFQLCGQDLSDPDSWFEIGLDQILDHIRTHWEQVCEENRIKTDHNMETKEQVLVGLSPEQEQVDSLKAEVQDYDHKLQTLQAQAESIRALKRGLEAALTDARRWQEVELQNRTSVVSRLESELSEVQTETEVQFRDLETLLSNKLRLEQEIQVYHSLLEGEESRYRDQDQTQGLDQEQTQGRDQDQTQG